MNNCACISRECPKYKRCANSESNNVVANTIKSYYLNECINGFLKHFEDIGGTRKYMYFVTNKENVESVLKDGLEGKSKMIHLSRKKSSLRSKEKNEAFRVDVTGYFYTRVMSGEDDFIVWNGYISPDRIKKVR